MSLLEVTGLRTEIVTREARVRPVDGVTFSIDKGEILGRSANPAPARP